MGQKVNPHGLRVGVIKDWDSRWFTTDKKEFGALLLEDHNIRTYFAIAFASILISSFLSKNGIIFSCYSFRRLCVL